MGKAINLKNRVRSYFQSRKSLGAKTTLLVQKTTDFEWIPVETELEALLLEAALIKKHLPFFNTRAKDDKHPLYIKITTGEEFPKITTSRREEEKGATYFGPFPKSSTVRRVLSLLRKIFPYCAQERIGKRPCFYSHLGLCNPCPAFVVKQKGKRRQELSQTYQENIKKLISVLEGKSKKVVRLLEKEMAQMAKKEEFEKATRVREQLRALAYLTSPYNPATAYIENPNLLEDQREEETSQLFVLLEDRLRLNKPPRRIECFDASHIAGESPTVAMVTFVNGEPEKSLYRRFKIRRKDKDDLALLEEALARRFAHRGWGIPDLLVLDGGKGQVRVAQKVLKKKRLKIPVIGFAKQFDNIFIPKKEGFLILRPKDLPALRLLQRVRDEAHRFARAYHHLLQAKKLTS